MQGRAAIPTIALLTALVPACGGPQLAVREVASPAAPGSAEPSVEAGGDGRAYLSWIEPSGGGRHALRFSVWETTSWSAPRTVAEGSDWFVNWADFPTVTALDDGTIAAHWLRKIGGGGVYAYGVQLSFSRDGGETWTQPITPHDDSPTEHGFVSKVPLSGGRTAVIWLDGREGGAMTLRGALVASGGNVLRDDRIDGRVCDCCQTGAVGLADGTLVVAYRDRSEAEIRDIAVARFDGERWSEPRVVHDDLWEMPGCPVNGPAIAADGERVAIAWYTAAGADPTPLVRVAFSRDGGRSFDSPIEVDAGHPEGRADIALLPDGAALVTWIDAGEGSARILARRVDSAGALGPRVPIAPTSAARASGFPRTARLGSEVLIAWTQPGDPSRVRTAVLSHER